ncbi:MAG: Hsp20 family protein [Gammaproteobacteria bacterium]|nr:Hsp20 family protein [Gammaproteobacteria bacterium]
MTTFDFTPLFRSAVGFDHLASMLENAQRQDNSGYPPYNIELTGEDHYRITLAVAGFTEDDLEIESHESTLTISSRKAPVEEEKKQRYLHRGIATRSFERKFQLADYVRVSGARLEHGLLHIDLVREVPEAAKPRKIAIGSAGSSAQKSVIEGEKSKAIENKAAA